MRAVPCDCGEDCGTWLLEGDEGLSKEQATILVAAESLYGALKDLHVVAQMFVSRTEIDPEKVMINLQDTDGVSLGVLNVQRVLDRVEAALAKAEGSLH